ncbi:MAG: 1-deoxy-D-xylulose-5-phosphate reductoisomerase, partial [Pseudomonadales bacterium]|jgi:1-deoxy-D-xylulose-5-phosphate reductoisomerase|nr:1-deoxy-D-xylulose-5-phosphate reductoisomerase [Pseudomonadales bacterium]
MSDSAAAERLQNALRQEGAPTEVLSGAQALEQVASAPEVDAVMAAIVGGAGLLPTLAAARAGKKVLLANKEALVMAGDIFMRAARDNGAVILPIDSEHNAIFQCLPVDAQGRFTHNAGCGFSKLILTASGGPFRERSLEELERITPEQACAHPIWRMGRKISVDSATLVNKGLELIEACHLFAVPPERVEVLIHPQSIVHSLVCYEDGSLLAQLGKPDMRTPIAYGLAWPERMASGVAPLDLTQAAKLEFYAPDLQRFPGLRLGYEAAQAGGAAPLLYNAANEIAVAAFLAGRIGFTRIPAIIARILDQSSLPMPNSLQDVLHCDAEARALAQRCLP